MNFVFDKAISGIGGLVNYGIYNSGSQAVMRIYGAGDVLLETFDLVADASISTPARANLGEFRGFSRNTADIFRLEMSGAVVIDDMVISYSSVPIPPAVWLFGTGLLGLIGVARRKKAA